VVGHAWLTIAQNAIFGTFCKVELAKWGVFWVFLKKIHFKMHFFGYIFSQFKIIL